MEYDLVIQKIADYFLTSKVYSDEDYQRAFLSLLDSISCIYETVQSAEPAKILEAIVPGTEVPLGARVPGTFLLLDPTQASFELVLLTGWFGHHESFPLTNREIHPSDLIGPIIAVADYISRKRIVRGLQPLKLKDVLDVLIKSYYCFVHLNQQLDLKSLGLDENFFLKVTSSAAVMKLMKPESLLIKAVISLAFGDGAQFGFKGFQSVKNENHRQAWRNGFETAQSIRLAYLVIQGQQGIPDILSDETYGLNKRVFGKSLNFDIHDKEINIFNQCMTRDHLNSRERIREKFKSKSQRFISPNQISECLALSDHISLGLDYSFSKIMDFFSFAR